MSSKKCLTVWNFASPASTRINKTFKHNKFSKINFETNSTSIKYDGNGQWKYKNRSIPQNISDQLNNYLNINLSKNFFLNYSLCLK